MSNVSASPNAGEKTKIKAAKNDHMIHVGLIMRSHNLGKSDAAVLAYVEGKDGLDARLQVRPLTPVKS